MKPPRRNRSRTIEGTALGIKAVWHFYDFFFVFFGVRRMTTG
jgi:hypothetical protein